MGVSKCDVAESATVIPMHNSKRPRVPRVVPSFSEHRNSVLLRCATQNEASILSFRKPPIRGSVNNFVVYFGDPSHRSVGLKEGEAGRRFRDRGEVVTSCDATTSPRYVTAFRQHLLCRHPIPVSPSAAPTRSFSKSALSNDRSTQDPPPPANEAWVLRSTLSTPSLGGFGGSLPPRNALYRSDFGGSLPPKRLT